MTTAVEINRTTDLTAQIPNLKRSGHYFSGPCPFCGGEDRFTIKRTDDGDLWHCRKCGTGKYQDAVAFLMRREGRSFAEIIGPQQGGPSQVALAKTTVTPPIDEPPDDDWQIPVLVALKPALDELNYLGSAQSMAIWDYLLKSRGLTQDIIRSASLGYNAEWFEVLPGCWLAPGIVIPCMVMGRLWYVKVRTTRAARAEAQARGKRLGKYAALKGSNTRALYNSRALKHPVSWAPVIPDETNRQLQQFGDPAQRQFSRTAVVVEGEFDALLLQRFLPPGWAAVTMGSAGVVPSAGFRYFLHAMDHIRLALDDDDAGRAGMAGWRKVFPAVETAPVLPGGAKDITDYWRAGGDLAAWALAEESAGTA